MVWPQVIEGGIESVNNADFPTPYLKEDIFYDKAANSLGPSTGDIKKYLGNNKKQKALKRIVSRRWK